MLDDMQHICRILDYHYEKYELHKVLPESKDLSEEERVILNNILSYN